MRKTDDAPKTHTVREVGFGKPFLIPFSQFPYFLRLLLLQIESCRTRNGEGKQRCPVGGVRHTTCFPICHPRDPPQKIEPTLMPSFSPKSEHATIDRSDTRSPQNGGRRRPRFCRRKTKCIFILAVRKKLQDIRACVQAGSFFSFSRCSAGRKKVKNVFPPLFLPPELAAAGESSTTFFMPHASLGPERGGGGGKRELLLPSFLPPSFLFFPPAFLSLSVWHTA